MHFILEFWAWLRQKKVKYFESMIKNRVRGRSRRMVLNLKQSLTKVAEPLSALI